jgi:ubiquinone/menaquinone biosynthesis C-methylase UbiE
MSERMHAGDWVPPWLRHEHFGRYQWACRFVQGREVLDAACGTGYGAEILVREGGAAKVDGFDVSTAAVTEACARFGGNGRLVFRVADVTALPVPDRSYDVYVSYETIEHIRDDRRFLEEAARLLRPGGLFLCSTPNRYVVDPGISIDDPPANPFHVREYTYEELDRLLRQYFEVTAWYGQTFRGRGWCSLLNRLGRRHPRLAVRLNQVQKVVGSLWRSRAYHDPRPLQTGRHPEVLLAVCRARSSTQEEGGP